MKNYVFDTSALLRYAEDGPGAARVEQIINLARMGECRVSMSAVSWGEVFYVLMRKLGQQRASSMLRALRALPLTVTSVFAPEAEQAGEFKGQHGVPYADAFVGALALIEGAILVTGDYDFKKCGSVVSVDLLPARAADRSA